MSEGHSGGNGVLYRLDTLIWLLSLIPSLLRRRRGTFPQLHHLGGHLVLGNKSSPAGLNMNSPGRKPGEFRK